MQPLDRDNAQVRRDAAAMLVATLHQRVENDEQRTRVRVLREADQAVRRRARLGRRAQGAASVREPRSFVRADGATARVGDQDARAISDALWGLGLLAGAATAAASIVDAIGTRPELRQPLRFTEREGKALRCASDGRVTWSLG
jgi:hypothetical protein